MNMIDFRQCMPSRMFASTRGIGLLVAGMLAMGTVAGAPATAFAGSYNIKAGQSSWLFSLNRYNEARCTPGAPRKYTLVQPKHGKFRVEKRTRAISRGACAGVKMTMQYLIYYPDPGFRGTDRGSIVMKDNFYNDATMITGSTNETIILNVR